MKKFGTIVLLMMLANEICGQITLSGTNYIQSFDNVGSGLPQGFSVRTGATASTIGSVASFNTAAISWNTATGEFRNAASYDGLASSSNGTVQGASADRVMAVRQSGGFGDVGAAFVMQLANTTGFTSFTLNFSIQSLDIASPRVATWIVDYGIGATPGTFTSVTSTPVTITTGGGSFSNTAVSLDFGTALDNINQPVWIRIVSLTSTTGSGNRPTTGIDDLSLNFNNGSGCTPPVVQASAPSISNISTTSFDISWSPGGGSNSLVVIKAGTEVAGVPSNGTSYTSNSIFGSGQTIAPNEFVVYNGTGNTVSVTGLSPGSPYHIAVFSFDGASNCYLTDLPAIADAATSCPQPTIQASSINISPGINFGIIGWTLGNGGNSLVKINLINSFTSPVDGTSYAANTTYSGGEQVVYNGTGNSVTVNGLTANTNYYVTVYTFNSCSGVPDYLATGNVIQSFTTVNAGSYYSSITNQTCSDLKTALRSITTSGHIQLDYGDIDDDNHPVTDDRLNDAGTQTIVWDIYSDNPTGAEPYQLLFSQFNTGGASEGQGWNKEHTFPNSWFSASSSTGNFPGSDLHQVLPTDIYVNSQRGNLPYGIVASPSNTFMNGGKKGSSSISFPGYGGEVFEPIDAYKGDVARIYFYMVTRYQNEQAAWENLELTGDVVMDGSPYPSIEINYLKMLLTWNAADPVSAKEIDRNNDVFAFQGNRNPFVDHPEYVPMIWAQYCGLVLPVVLSSFQLIADGNTIHLQWKIENADNFSHFQIERSVDGTTFTTLANVNWQNGVMEYSYADDVSALAGKITYRLRMIDQNNAFKYSKTVSTTLATFEGAPALYPNPAKEVVTIVFRSSLPRNTTINVTDVLGKSVGLFYLNDGQTVYHLPTSNLGNGLYFLRWASGTRQGTTKFIIQR